MKQRFLPSVLLTLSLTGITSSLIANPSSTAKRFLTSIYAGGMVGVANYLALDAANKRYPKYNCIASSQAKRSLSLKSALATSFAVMGPAHPLFYGVALAIGTATVNEHFEAFEFEDFEQKN